MLIYFGVLSLLDAALTAFGLKVGCVELDRLVLTLGFWPWTLLRVGLIVYLVAVFFLAYQFSKKNPSKRSAGLIKGVLFLLNAYIGAIVFSGILSVFSTIRL
jgi:hypothetical protein